MQIDEIKNKVFAVLGREVSFYGRKRLQIIAKLLVAYLMRDQYDIVEIAEALHVNRTTVYHYFNRIDDILQYPHVFRESKYINMLNGN